MFATDVMTSVAKGIDAPILLQFPQDIYRNGWRDATKYSMLGLIHFFVLMLILGLGDIVIPGVFIALLKRFDERIVGKKEAKKGETLKGRYYFAVTCFAYALGLLITMAVMHHFKVVLQSFSEINHSGCSTSSSLSRTMLPVYSPLAGFASWRS